MDRRDSSEKTFVPWYDQLPVWSSIAKYDGKKCVDPYGLLKNLPVASVGSNLIAWIPTTDKEALCPYCRRRVPVGRVLFDRVYGNNGNENSELFVKGIELYEYNIIHRIECFWDEVDAFLDPPTSTHILTVGQLHLTGHNKCLKQVLRSRLRGF